MTLPTFPEFFRALQTGDAPHDPFPWQRRLAERVVAGGWPDEIGVPTGLGKTTCLDIGVWAMAVDEIAGRRLWYVVNRRLLVDAASERARHIAALLREAEAGPLRAVADALRARAALGVDAGGHADPLHVARLRGGVPLDTSAPDPSQPTLLLATVPMYASRLLLRGYGVSRGMRPIAAAHAGLDATVLLDEAHLSRPLRDLMRPLRECDPGDASAVLPATRAGARLVSLTATGDSTGERLDLDKEDLAHPLVRQRLSARKPTQLVEVKYRQLSDTLAAEAVALLTTEASGSTCVIFVNTASRAPAVAVCVQKEARRAKLDVELQVLTGRVRGADAAGVRDRLLDEREGVVSGWALDRDRPLVVVATQTLEVGADLDFEHLVTESAGVRALVQRFGRLNRLGTRNEVASAVIVHATDRKDHPVYGDEVDVVWERLRGSTANEGGAVDLGPASVDMLGHPGDAPTVVPSLLPHHLWEWAKTSVDQQPPTPVEPFFAGLDDPSPTVTVLWRWWLPEGEPLFPRPHADEVLGLPLWEVRSFIDDRDVVAHRLDLDDLRLSPATSSARLRPGDTVVLPVSAGGYRSGAVGEAAVGWDPTSGQRVRDVTLDEGFVPVSVRGDGLPTLPPEWSVDDDEADELRRLLRDLRRAHLPAEPADDAPDPDEALAALVTALTTAASPGSGVSETLEAWGSSDDSPRPRPVVEVVGDTVVLRPPPADPSRSVLDVRIDAFDDLAFDQSSTSLEEHLGSVGAAAERIAEALALPPELVDAVKLAGALHDVGKADPRFQRVLDPNGTPERLLAKSSLETNTYARPAPSGWPRGGRHEALSSLAVQRWFEEGHGPGDVDHDLVVHLVASHHGHGRSLVRPVPSDRFATDVAIPVDGVRVVVDGDLSRADWDQPRRFRQLTERYGTWGLALLEAIVRQADHAASAATRRETTNDSTW